MKVQTRKMTENFKPSNEISWHNCLNGISFLTHGDFRQLQGKLERKDETIEALQEVLEAVKEGEVDPKDIDEVVEHMLSGEKDGICRDCKDHTSVRPTVDLGYEESGGCCGAGIYDI